MTDARWVVYKYNCMNMKNLFIILAVVAAMSATSACDKYEDGRPSKDVRTEFENMYPGAKDVEWEYEGRCWKVSFETGTSPNRIDREAWFDMDGNWIRTETDMLLSAVPQNIRAFLEASEYGQAILSDRDVDYVETPEGNYYRFEIVLNGLEVYVDVTESGDVSIGGLDW